MLTGIKRFLLLVIACLLLLGCAMQPQAVRESLDECDQLGFDALVYNREGDGAVMKVLCIPSGDEVEHSATYPFKWSRIINRLIPSQADTKTNNDAGTQAQ